MSLVSVRARATCHAETQTYADNFDELARLNEILDDPPSEDDDQDEQDQPDDDDDDYDGDQGRSKKDPEPEPKSKVDQEKNEADNDDEVELAKEEEDDVKPGDEGSVKGEEMEEPTQEEDPSQERKRPYDHASQGLKFPIQSRLLSEAQDRVTVNPFLLTSPCLKLHHHNREHPRLRALL